MLHISLFTFININISDKSTKLQRNQPHWPLATGSKIKIGDNADHGLLASAVILHIYLAKKSLVKGFPGTQRSESSQ